MTIPLSLPSDRPQSAVGLTLVKVGAEKTDDAGDRVRFAHVGAGIRQAFLATFTSKVKPCKTLPIGREEDEVSTAVCSWYLRALRALFVRCLMFIATCVDRFSFRWKIRTRGDYSALRILCEAKCLFSGTKFNFGGLSGGYPLLFLYTPLTRKCFELCLKKNRDPVI